MKERKFSRELREILADYGLRAHAMENRIIAGMPDLLIIIPGREPIWAELKVTPKGLDLTQVMWRRNNPDENVIFISQIGSRLHVARWLPKSRDWKTLLECKWPMDSHNPLYEAISMPR